MSIKPTTTIRIDPEVKHLAGKVFDDIGLSMSAAINTFLKAVAREGTMPLDIKTGTPRAHVTSGNAALNRAFLLKKDEFYTQYEDVAREMVKHRDSFRGKTIFCNCDGLCCTTPVRDSSRESSVIAGGHEQTEHTDLQDLELARV